MIRVYTIIGGAEIIKFTTDEYAKRKPEVL